MLLQVAQGMGMVSVVGYVPWGSPAGIRPLLLDLLGTTDEWSHLYLLLRLCDLLPFSDYNLYNAPHGAVHDDCGGEGCIHRCVSYEVYLCSFRVMGPA